MPRSWSTLLNEDKNLSTSATWRTSRQTEGPSTTAVCSDSILYCPECISCFGFLKKAAIRHRLENLNIPQTGAFLIGNVLNTTLTNQNCIQVEVKTRMKLGNACYHSVQKLLSSCLLSKNLKIKMYRTMILPVVLYGCESWSLTSR